MRELRLMAKILIVSLYVGLGSFYVCNKNYTGEEAEVSPIGSDNSTTLLVYVPKYMIHLEMPEEDCPKQDEFILQKDYRLSLKTFCLMGITILVCIMLFIVSLTILLEEHKTKKT